MSLRSFGMPCATGADVSMLLRRKASAARSLYCFLYYEAARDISARRGRLRELRM